MYDEFERAAGVRRRPGISLLGWVGIGLLTLMLLGATGMWLAYRAVRGQVQEVVERVQLHRPTGAPRMVARTVARTLGEMGTAPAAQEDRIATAVARALAVSGPEARQVQVGEDEVEGFLRIRTRDGEVVADLRAGEDGGSLVVRDGDGEVLVDLSGDARGGRLYIRGEGEVARFETGDRAQGPPGWVPAVGDRVMELERVISGHAGEGDFGALTWLSSASPESLVDDYRERLEADGWEIRAEHRLESRDESSASVVAHRPGMERTVLLTAGPEDGDTRVVLGWGEASSAP